MDAGFEKETATAGYIDSDGSSNGAQTVKGKGKGPALPLTGKGKVSKDKPGCGDDGGLTHDGDANRGKAKGPVCSGKGKPVGKEELEAAHTACQFDDEASLHGMLVGDPPLSINNCTRRGTTLLHTASTNGSARIVRLLLAHGITIDATNSWRETSLHVAAAAGQLAVVEILINAKSALEACDRWNRTPVSVAQQNSAGAIVECLIKAGASRPIADDVPSQLSHSNMEQGQKVQQKELVTEFMSHMQDRPERAVPEPIVKHIFNAPSNVVGTSSGASSQSKPAQNRRALSKLVEYPGDPEVVAKLLVDPGIDPAGRDMFSLTALHKFAAWNKVDLLQLLLPHLGEADVNSTGGDEGFSALHHALSMGAVQSVEVLLRDPRISCSVCDKAGRTPLEFTAASPEMQKLFDMFSKALQSKDAGET